MNRTRELASAKLAIVLFIFLTSFTAGLRAARADELDLSLLERHTEIEAGFVDLGAEVWLPGPGTFIDNHRVSPTAVGEVGARVLSFRDHNLFVALGLTFSPQRLRAHLAKIAARSTSRAWAFVICPPCCARPNASCVHSWKRASESRSKARKTKRGTGPPAERSRRVEG